MRAIIALVLVAWLTTAGFSIPPYEENVDARSSIRIASAEAERASLPLLIVFGANWCSDSMTLDYAIKRGMAAPLISKNFKVVQIDAGHRDRNVDVAGSYGVSLSNGIPAIVVLTKDGKIAYATKAGELANADKMGDRNLYNFFARIVGQDAGMPKQSVGVVTSNAPQRNNLTIQNAPRAPITRAAPTVVSNRFTLPNRPRLIAPRR